MSQLSSNNIKAFILLLSFLGVQVISLVCTVIKLGHKITHSFHEQSSHAHHHHNHSQTHHDDMENEEDEESCCVENASVFLNGMEAIATDVQFNLKVFQFVLWANAFQNPYSIGFYQVLIDQIRPPPLITLKACDLRILIQSFLI